MPRGGPEVPDRPAGQDRRAKPVEAQASVKARGEEVRGRHGIEPGAARAGHAESEYLALEAHAAGADARAGEKPSSHQ